MTETQARPKFTAEMWAAFWAAPSASRIDDILAEDIVGYWQGDPIPVHGRDAYAGKIAELVAGTPDLRLELVRPDRVAPARQPAHDGAPGTRGPNRRRLHPD